ncbi:MAG: branched-chain amino acid transport system substrate-binding protein, partial [Myxococcales bacterium]|nr:branched-chain amino acid transport system substrate-binding protein [Myxococcales bacterium]
PAPSPTTARTVVKLVSSLPRAGASRAQSDAIVNGIRQAIAEQNGQVGKFSIAYEDWDDASPQSGDWDPDLEAANARRAVSDPDVLFYLGPYNSGAAKVSLPVLNRAGLVAISPANSYAGLTKPGSAEPNEPEIYRPTGKITYYRVSPTDDIQGKVAAEFAKYKGWKRVYVLHDGGLYGQGTADIFLSTAAQLGLPLVSSAAEKIDPQAPEYLAILQRIRRLRPDAIYFGGTTQPSGGRIARDVLTAAGPQGRLLAPNGCFQTTFIKAAGADVLNERAFVTFGGLPPDQLTGGGAAFVAAYRQRFKIEPEGYSVNGYVVAQVALKALAKAGRKNREAVRQAMVGSGQVDGALGTWQFDANGDTSLATISVSTVKDGRFQFVTAVNQDAAN